ncbi:hypothetical protein Syun_001628 [Stephania yunnanensis]|uniref:Uncharacterized protein n=1 Tax=Stephania yunnanensis TaxID=152371 RepID=A0AAP0LF62_9MAGN
MKDDSSERRDVVDSGDAPVEAQVRPTAVADDRQAEATRRTAQRSFAAAMTTWTAATRFHGDGVIRKEERYSCPKRL